MALLSCGRKPSASQSVSAADELQSADTAVVASTVAETPSPADETPIVIPTHEQVMQLLNEAWMNEAKLTDDNPLLQALGMKTIRYSYDVDDEEPIVYASGYYGINAEMREVTIHDEDFTFTIERPVATARHAIVIAMVLATDNDEFIYFSDEDDMRAFLATFPADSEEYCPWSPSFDENTGMWECRAHIWG